VQETILEMVRSAGTFRGEASAVTWACAIARRRVARYWDGERRAEVERAGFEVVADEPDATPAVDQRDEVVRALAHLPATQRQVLVLKYIDDKSVAEVATEMGKTPVQVQSLLQLARDGLRRELEDSDG
jgi:RNA polymerase sigma-70 factor (ECF subfamily)